VAPYSIPTSGLVAYYKFEEGGSATTVIDSSVSGYNGTWNGTGTHYAAGKVGSYAGQFNGVNGNSDYVDVGSRSGLLFNSGNFTLASWIKIAGTTTGGEHDVSSQTVMSFFNSAGNLGYLFGRKNLAPEYINYYSISPHLGGTTLSNGAWYHIAVTIDSSGNYIIYLNGLANGSGTSTLPPQDGGGSSQSSSSFKIGGYDPSGLESPFYGLIDEAVVYNRVLSSGEISAIYNGQK
jgi:hypothetical protein